MAWNVSGPFFQLIVRAQKRPVDFRLDPGLVEGRPTPSVCNPCITNLPAAGLPIELSTPIQNMKRTYYIFQAGKTRGGELFVKWGKISMGPEQSREYMGGDE